MSKWTATAGEIIAALSKFPADTPVFAYSNLDECDVPIEICEIRPEPYFEVYDGETFMHAPFGCQGDSHVERYYNEQGPGPVIYLRDRTWFDDEGDPKPITF